MTSIESILKEKGPLLSSDLLRILEERNPGIKPDAIRKRLSRVKPEVKKIYGFFSDKQAFHYLEDHKGSEPFYLALRSSIKKSAKRLDTIITALEYNHGYCDVNQLAAFTFSPVLRLKGHKLFQAVLDHLRNFGVIHSDGSYYTINGNYYTASEKGLKQYQAEQVATNFVLRQFREWAAKMALVSFNAGSFYTEFAKFEWCFTAPSYIAGIRKFVDGKIIPAFLVADILIGSQVEERNINFFLEKINILNAQKSIPRFLPFLIVDYVEPNALTKLREKGIVIAFVSQLFGQQYSDLLRSLVNTVVNAAAILKKDPEQFVTLLEKIEKLAGGQTNNLRGDLFELAVGIYHSRNAKSFDIGKRFNYEGAWKEIDVVAVYPDKIYAAECKGHRSLLNLEEVEAWLNKISVTRKYLLDIPPYADLEFVAELWSTGGFSDDALVKLRSVSNTVTKYKILYYDKDAILQKFGEIKSKKITEALKQYYFSDKL